MMKKLKTFLSASKANVAVFTLVAVLILTATIGAASAAVAYVAETYANRVDIYDIGVSIIENNERISWRNYVSRTDSEWDEYAGTLLENMLASGENLTLGKAYQENLSIRNSGTINEYIRVSIFKYWVDEETGVKQSNLNPDYIDLHLIGLDQNWLEDVSAKTAERTVLYYNRRLNSGEETPAFSDTITISPGLYKYGDAYDGKKFVVEINVDAIQEQNGQDVARSAWGINVIIDQDAGTLALG